MEAGGCASRSDSAPPPACEPDEKTSDPRGGGAARATREKPSPPRRGRTSWAALLARVFYVQALLCPKCGGRRKVLSFLQDPEVVRKILTHLGLESTPPPFWPARVPEVAVWESGLYSANSAADSVQG